MAGYFIKTIFGRLEKVGYKEVLFTFVLIIAIVGFNIYLVDKFKGLPKSDLITTFLWVNLNLTILALLVYLSIRKFYKEWVKNRSSQLWKKLSIIFLSIFAVPFLFLIGLAIIGQSSYLRVFTSEQLKVVIEKLNNLERDLASNSISEQKELKLKKEVDNLKTSAEKLRQLVRHQKVILTNYMLTYLTIASLVIFGAVVVSTLLAKVISREIEKFSKALREFSKGNFEVRLPEDDYLTKSVKELKDLTVSFNLAVERSKNLYQELKMEKRLLDTVFNKVKTPIAIFYKKNGKLFKANDAYKTSFGLNNLEDLKRFVEGKDSYRFEEIPLGALNLVVVEDLTDYLYAKRYKMWKEVASRLAHDIKNPLHIMQTSAETLVEIFRRYLEKENEPKNKKALRELVLREMPRMLESIRKNTAYIADLIDSFNNLSSEDENLQRRWFSLRELLLELKRNFETSNFKVFVEVSPFYVFGDKQKLRRVFENLIRNSYEAIQREMEKNPSKVKGGWIRFSTEGNVIHIWDNGPGIPPEKWSTVFLPFASDKAKGRGLGLFIVRKFIDEHGWNIKLTPPKDGKGAHFIIEVAKKDYKTRLK